MTKLDCGCVLKIARDYLAGPEYARFLAIDWCQLHRDAAATNAEVDQLRVQLAGCSVAALGGIFDPAKQSDYGWSPAYQDTLNLRLRFEAVRESHDRLLDALHDMVDMDRDDDPADRAAVYAKARAAIAAAPKETP